MILGLHGKMRAGKNEAARRLALYSPLPVVEVSFAAKLKESAAALLGCTVDDLEAWKNMPNLYVAIVDARTENIHGPESRQTVRSFLQRYGTEAHRDVFGDSFWIDTTLPFRYEGHGQKLGDAYEDALYVVTDVRFPNEAQRVHDLGGLVVKLIGPETDTGAHASEQDLGADYTINNLVRTDGFRALDGQLRDLLDVALGGSMAA